MEVSRYWKPRWWRETLIPKAQEVAAQPRASIIVCLLELAGLTIFPIPVALILVAFVTAAPRKWLPFALSATTGSIIGSMVLYLVGYAFFHSIGERLIAFYGMQERWSDIVEKFDGNFGITLILIAGMTTGLVRLASLAAGFTVFNPLFFLLLMAASRVVRFVAECAAIKFVGERALAMPRRSYKYVALAVGSAILIALAILTFAS